MRDMTPIQALRALTGIINLDHAVSIVALVNLLARYLDHDELLEESFLIERFEKNRGEFNIR